ncbi:MAG TPA: division/cell wall cluster transcriptional repressor MraZ [bacterium]|nr:division/cell wall cluster transcriptional repressor MraZ [bacterium]HPL95234.1 division/cell wall cluster transcriptional repressor MraZ [bacterium]
MFIGEYQHSLDNKNRLSLPAKFKVELKSGAVVTRGLDNCLFVFTKSAWQKLAEKIISQPLGKADARGFSRIMLAGAMDVSLDSLGRILLPDYLKKYASLNKNVIVAGLYNRLEIWDENNWRRYQSQIERQADKLAEAMGELGV